MTEVHKGKERGLSIEVEFLHRAIDLIESAVIVTNTSGNMLFLNRKARDLFGYSTKGPVDKSIGILFLPDDLVNFLPNILKITRNEGEFRGEILLRKKNGKRIFVKLEASLYQGGRGNEGRIVFTIQDIEILKDLERDYLESQRLASLGRMVERISHTIRNPMVSIGGFARRISRNLADEDLIGYFKRIEREIDRLEAIIDQVQKFAAVPKPTHRQEDIREAIDKLPEHHRAVVVLRYLQDFSYNEIADSLDLPLNTVKSYLFRARQQLQSLLQDYQKGGVRG